MSSISPKKSESLFWRSLGQLKGSKTYKSFLHREFQKDASVLEEGVSRRTFLKLSGATMAMAGAIGCSFRKPIQKIMPYARKPENITPGLPTYFATSMNLGEDVLGLVVETHEGRPTKVEGNSLHPSSLGATHIHHQASVLDLYDPDRRQYVVRSGSESTQTEFDSWFDLKLKELRGVKGKGLVILSETIMSPTVSRISRNVKEQLPESQLYRYSPVNGDSVFQGLSLVAGKPMSPHFRFDHADIVVSFDSDFLGQEVGSVAYSKSFSKRRDPEFGPMNRLYVFENHFSITGSKSDHRIRLRSSEVELALLHLANALQVRGVVSLSSDLRSVISQAVKHPVPVDPKIFNAIVDDLGGNRGKSLLVAGSRQSEAVSALVAVLNDSLGNTGKTVFYKALPFQDSGFSNDTHLASIKSVVASMKAGAVDTLIIVGGNPVFNAPSDLDFVGSLSKVKHVVHLTLHKNDTSRHSEWIVPRSHYMEAWGDLETLSGVTSVVQPLIRPLYKTASDLEMFLKIAGDSSTAYQSVRATWNVQSSETSWRRYLHDGVISAQTSFIDKPTFNSEKIVSVLQKSLSSFLDSSDLEVVFRPSYALYDGRFSNNGWLQELPDPMTKLVWDNAALISNALSKKLHLKNEDKIKLSVEGKTIVAPVYVMPGHADNSISLYFGYGSGLGRVDSGSGFDVYPLRTSSAMNVARRASLVKEKGKYRLASTQEHGSLEGRPIYREDTQTHYHEEPGHIKEMEEVPHSKSLFDEIKYDTGYQWGMAIDLSKCTGCNVCIVACQSENNIPIVGKKQALNGREMHWIRVDRYFEGSIEDPVMVEQPMTCLQCENAPCEQVCPVAATAHTKEGLNDMTYNRCIGTRYCSDNCPVKVRRFNFFDYHQRNPQSVDKEKTHFFDYMKEPAKSVQMQFNPDVTVRMRGVMEKCTYCVQRISYGKKQAKLEERLIKDGEVESACQQACPAEAIAFGNILDPESKVSKMKAKQRDYHILEGLYLKPRTSYLASIRNPHPSLEKSYREKVVS